MYSNFQLLFNYSKYYLNASNSKGHGIHSPFIFDFILNVLNNKAGYHPTGASENLRSVLLKNKSVLELQDFGAGSRVNKRRQKTVAELAKSAVKPKKYSQLLFRLVRHYQPSTIIELGTSLGVTTTYLAEANPNATILTIEGSQAVHKIAQSNFKQSGLDNITALNGNFDTILPPVISQLPVIDLAFIDGNHRYHPTMQYFNQLVEKINKNTILVFDDIHWSPEMERAWREIKSHPAVRCTIDIFFMGFLFFRNEFKEKQDFTIRF
ncbi:MAG: class I SAM-dependent methyltransferase [Bacteroidota bacterium]|nr:class I SAM-dependent methyltransferase [Bacteroidota bacterium]